MAYLGQPRVYEIVAALLDKGSGGDNLRIVQLEENFATLVGASGRIIRIFRHPGRHEVVEQIIEDTLAHNQRSGTDIVFVGGSDSSPIEGTIPKLLHHHFRVIHVRKSGDVESFPRSRAKRDRIVQALESIALLGEADLRGLLEKAEADQQFERVDDEERAVFFGKLRDRKPVATYAILALIGIMYLLQMLWMPQGAPAGVARLFLLKMGALSAEAANQGEWWRLISVGFLHGGLMHVGANSFVLYLLGGQLEKVLGSSRFVVIYSIALLGGSFFSMKMLGAGISVGASGAIWGLLGAQVALAYGRPPVLPTSIAQSMRPVAKQNLMLNIGISFMANIDWAAHFGGGLAGAAVLVSGVLYTGKGEDEPPWLTKVAIFCAIFLVWGVLAALRAGQPWQLASLVLTNQ